MTTDSNVTPMPTSLERLRRRLDTVCQHISKGKAEWVDDSLELIQILAEARGHFQSDNAFGAWLKEVNHDDISKDDRAALINMASDLTLAHEVLTQTDRRSYQHIWRENMSRFRHVTKPTHNRRKNNTVARNHHKSGEHKATKQKSKPAPTVHSAEPTAPQATDLDSVRQYIADNLEFTDKALAATLKIDESRVRRARAAIVKAGGYVKQEQPARPVPGSGLAELAKKYTPEEIGWPAPDIIDLPHPDHPGHTYGGWFIQEHGHVHLMPVKEREIRRRQGMAKVIIGIIYNLGKAAREGMRDIENNAKDLKVKLPLDIADYQEIFATMEDEGKLQIKRLGTYYDDLTKMLHMVESLGTLVTSQSKAKETASP